MQEPPEDDVVNPVPQFIFLAQITFRVLALSLCQELGLTRVHSERVFVHDCATQSFLLLNFPHFPVSSSIFSSCSSTYSFHNTYFCCLCVRVRTTQHIFPMWIWGSVYLCICVCRSAFIAYSCYFCIPPACSRQWWQIHRPRLVNKRSRGWKVKLSPALAKSQDDIRSVPRTFVNMQRYTSTSSFEAFLQSQTWVSQLLLEIIRESREHYLARFIAFDTHTHSKGKSFYCFSSNRDGSTVLRTSPPSWNWIPFWEELLISQLSLSIPGEK